MQVAPANFLLFHLETISFGETIISMYRIMTLQTLPVHFSKIKLNCNEESQGGESSLFWGKNVYGILQDASGYMWISADNGLIRLYSETGTYTLLVKGSNNDGVWNEPPAELTIDFLPPPWQTGWAYLLYILAIGSVTITIANNGIYGRFSLHKSYHGM
jgi:hypothetical protein